jgi:hypothetical protein
MEGTVYLVGYGLRGELGRFRSEVPVVWERGDRVVIQSPRGVEIGEVLRPAPPRVDELLPDAASGPLLRPVSAGDELQAAAMGRRAAEVFERGRGVLGELSLPLELLDVEVLLDGEHAVLHHLRWEPSDVRPFVSTLSREFELYISLLDLTHRSSGCGDCGGGCGSCGSGGCGSGSCSSGTRPEEVKAYFVGLREKMDRRYSLL